MISYLKSHDLIAGKNAEYGKEIELNSKKFDSTYA
jgi:hypothetical protein